MDDMLFFRVSGLICFFWWVLDLFLKLRYPGEYSFLWFCSVAMLALSIGLFFRHPLSIYSFLSIALIAQTYYVVDFWLQATILQNKYALTYYLFDYGLRPIELFNSLRHFFMLPLGLFAVLRIKKPSKYSIHFTALIIPLGMLFSYFLTTTHTNINCVLYPCGFPEIKIAIYPLLFTFISVILCAFILNPLIQGLIIRTKKNKTLDKSLYSATYLMFLIGFITILASIIIYTTIPHYNCTTNTKNLICKGTSTSYYDGKLYAEYYFISPENDCRLDFFIEQSLYHSTYIPKTEKPLKWDLEVPVPSKNTQLHIEKTCS